MLEHERAKKRIIDENVSLIDFKFDGKDNDNGNEFSNIL
jgi:hypothetical protein